MQVTILIFSLVALAAGQRPFFAGSRPIGYPEVTTEGLVDKFGEDGTTQRLPIEANGDRDLVDRLSKLPIDQQPFWFINWQALEAHREQGQQTYPQKPNQFIDPIPNTGSNNIANSNPSNANSNLGSSNSNLGSSNSNFGGSNSNLGSSNSNLGSSNSNFGGSNSNLGSSNSNLGSSNSNFGGSNSNLGSSNSNFPNSNSNFPNSNSNFANSNPSAGDALTSGTPPKTNVNNNFPGNPVQADLLNRFGEGDSKPDSGSGNSNPRPVNSMTSSFGAQNVNVPSVVPTTTPAPVKTTQRAPYYYQ